ncbi:hypothetical protein AB1L88_25780 [Tautonia sp. JC769]|uniref:hypothetical protein n=1 Tax=Tautonia sp. JC769 TaxID=3232135 RepID=UPI003458FE70
MIYQIATVLGDLTARHIDPQGRSLLVLDDSPTKRYGPEVQGAGIHHNPTPGPPGGAVERPNGPPMGRSGASAIARRSTQGVAVDDDRGGISADRHPGAVVGDIPSAPGGRGPEGGMTLVTSGKVQIEPYKLKI